MANEYAKNIAKKHKLEQKFESLEKKYHDNLKMEKAITSDAKLIKDQIRKVENSSLSNADKKEILEYLKKETGVLKSNFDAIENNNKVLMDEGNKINLEILQTSAKLDKQAEEIQKIVLNTKKVDLSKASDAAIKKKEEYQMMSKTILEKLKKDLEESKKMKEKMEG